MEIRGHWETKQVWIGGREVRPARSVRVRHHSPEGFSWGDGGSGSAQLALALLLELTHENLALLWYQDVKGHIVARLAQDDFVTRLSGDRGLHRQRGESGVRVGASITGKHT